MDKFDDLLFNLLSEKNPRDGDRARLVFKRVLLIEKRKKVLTALFLILLSYPLFYYFIFGLPYGLFTNLYSVINSVVTLFNLGLLSHLLTLMPIIMFFITLLTYLFTRVMKLNRISLRMI